MAEEKPVGCVAPAAGPLVPSVELAHTEPLPGSGKPKGDQMAVMVGKTAPDFEAAAFAGGGFKNVKLSDFRGKWVFLCFYPGDFTFV